MSVLKAGVLPPHPHSLVVAARNRLAPATAALTSDVQEEAEKDEEALEGNEGNVENDEHMGTEENKDNDQHVQNEENKDSKNLEEDKKDP